MSLTPVLVDAETYKWFLERYGPNRSKVQHAISAVLQERIDEEELDSHPDDDSDTPVNEDLDRKLSEEDLRKVEKIEKVFKRQNLSGVTRGPEGGVQTLRTPQYCTIDTLLGVFPRMYTRAYFCKFACDDGKDRPKPVCEANIHIAIVLYQRGFLNS